jgi:hypothetical protein
MAPTSAIVIATVQRIGRSFNEFQWKLSSLPVWFGVGFDSTRGQAKFTSMPAPQRIPGAVMGMPQLPSENGAGTRGQPRLRARMTARLQTR